MLMPDPLHCCTCHQNQYLLLIKNFAAGTYSLEVNGVGIGVSWMDTSPTTVQPQVFTTDLTLTHDASSAVFTPTGQGLPSSTLHIEAGSEGGFRSNLLMPGTTPCKIVNGDTAFNTFSIYQLQAINTGGFKWQILSQKLNQSVVRTAGGAAFNITINPDGSIG